MLVDIYYVLTEFYTLQAIDVLAQPDPFKRFQVAWARDFQAYKALFETRTARALFDYLALISWGEARHSWGYTTPAVWIPAVGPGGDRSAAYYRAARYDPADFLPKVHSLFNFDWTSRAYGGESWAKIARAAMLYGRIPDAVFIDHCADLRHNSALCFDKTTAGIFAQGDCDLVTDLLNYKFASQPLKFLIVYAERASATLQQLILRAEALGLLPWGILRSLNYTSSNNLTTFLLSYLPIAWGTKTISDPVPFPQSEGGDSDDQVEAFEWSATTFEYNAKPSGRANTSVA